MAPFVNKKCTIAGCTNRMHSRGMCRCHYGRWHRGTPIDGPAPVEVKVSAEVVTAAQLDAVRDAYSKACGFECRMKWRRRMIELESKINPSGASNEFSPSM